MKTELGKKVPAQSFGSNHMDNLVLACEKCNREKFNQLPMEK
jgi:5-methylcytosine-specific restriction endonuclease McrA